MKRKLVMAMANGYCEEGYKEKKNENNIVKSCSEGKKEKKIVNEYCEEKKKETKKELGEEKKKTVRGCNNRNRGGMQVVGRDSNGKLILVEKCYAEAKEEQELKKEEEKLKKKKKKEELGESDSEPEEPWEPRWSDENLAMHIWRGVCRRKGVKCHEYVLRTDYSNMTRQEIELDLLWTKVYQAEAEEDAAEAAAEEAALAITTTA